MENSIKKNIYDSMDPEAYENRGSRNEKNKYLNEHWLPLMSAVIAKYSKDSIVLDLGCGTGDRSFEMTKYAKKVFGLDSSKNMLDYGKKKYQGVEFIHANATNIPFKNSYVDTVFSFGLAEYIDDKEKLMKEIFRVLKPSGTAVVTVTNIFSIPFFLSEIYSRIVGKKRVTSDPSFGQMMKIFRMSGFEVIEFKMDDGLLWLPYLDRFLGEKFYLFVENFFKFFKRNPLSTVMFFIIIKNID